MHWQPTKQPSKRSIQIARRLTTASWNLGLLEMRCGKHGLPTHSPYMLTSLSLRQVFTNLSSNAVKFSQPGGRIEIVTRLLYPCPPGCGPVPPLTPGEFGAEIQVGRNETAGVAVHGTSTAPAVKAPSLPIPVPVMRPQFVRKSSARGRSVAEKRLSSSNVPQVGAPINEKTGSTSVPLAIPLDQIVVRIEVRDAGVGIKLQDARDARLFSPYVQTEIGRYQGGKGTGLGLALVRRIVKLSGGRLGVKSKVRLHTAIICARSDSLRLFSLTRVAVSGWNFLWELAVGPFKLPLRMGLVEASLLDQSQCPSLLHATLDCRSLTLTKFLRNDAGKRRPVERLH